MNASWYKGQYWKQLAFTGGLVLCQSFWCTHSSINWCNPHISERETVPSLHFNRMKTEAQTSYAVAQDTAACAKAIPFWDTPFSAVGHWDRQMECSIMELLWNKPWVFGPLPSDAAMGTLWSCCVLYSLPSNCFWASGPAEPSVS